MSTEERQNLEFLKIQHGALMALGLDIGATRGKRLLKHIWKFVFNGLCTTYMQYGFFNHVAHHITNIDTVTSELSMFNQGILLAIKVMLIVIKGDALLKLIWQMNTLAAEANSAEHDKWLAENRRGEWIAKSYFYACWTCVTLASTVPLILLCYEYAKGLGLHLAMPFQVALPFDDASVGFAIFIYVLTFVHIRALLSMSVGIDTLFGWYIHAVSGHFRILRIKIEETARRITLENNHEEFIKDVGSFVRYHNKTLQFLEDLNFIFGEILWAEISFSCLQICFMLYTLTNERNAEKTPFHLMAFMSITLQLVIYCFGGEKIKNENDMLCDDIYMKMPWEKMYPSERKLMLLPLIRAQREASLIGLFFNLNRNLLVYIFKTAFSFITLLGAMKE